MSKTISVNDINSAVGQQLPAGEWITVDQESINQFADITHDHQFIHIDPEAAKNTPFGTTIAHGFLSLSLLTHLMKDIILVPENTQIAMNYGFDKVRFINPVKSGSQIRARAVVKQVTPKNSSQYLFNYQVTVEIKGETKPALVCEWLNYFFVE